MSKIKYILIILLSFLVISCNNSENNIADSSNSLTIDESTTEDDSSTIIEESSSDVKYEKDEEGFYILEDDYFKDDNVDDGLPKSSIKYAKEIDASYRSKDMRLFVGSNNIPLYSCKSNYSHTWNPNPTQRIDNGVGIIELDGKVTLKLQTSFAILGRCTIRPLGANIIPIIDENRRVVTFTIDSPGNYTIDFRSDRTLHLFVNKKGEFDSYKQDSNVILFEAGIHNKSNDSRINNRNEITLQSNTTVFVEYGAIVQARFVANSKNNIKMVGGGIIDGRKFDRNADTGAVTVPYDFNYCNKLLFKGIVTTDPAGWCYNLYFSKNIELDNIKIISSRSNGDGISLQSCEDVYAHDCFVRTWDDSLVVKNYPRWQNKDNEGATRNILFEDCIIWTDLAQSMEIGFETIGEVMDNIKFNNITVLHNFHKAVISIHNANNANLTNVEFTNITVEDASMGKGDGNNVLIDFSTAFSSTWSTNHKTTALGSIDGVLVENVNVLSANNPKVSILGYHDSRDNTDHFINNVTIKNVSIAGVLLDENYDKLETNNLVTNLSFKNDNKITGATINKEDTSSYGSGINVVAI